MQSKVPCSICNQPTAAADEVTIQRVATKEGVVYYLSVSPLALECTVDKAFIIPATACQRCVSAWKAADPTLPAHLALGAADSGSFIAPAWQNEKAQAPAGYVH